MLKGFLSNFGKKNERFKEMETEATMQRRIQAKQMTSNERELLRFEEEQRQRDIKNRLEQFRQLRKDEDRQNNMLTAPSVFDHRANVMDQDKNVLTDNKSFLHQGGLI